MINISQLNWGGAEILYLIIIFAVGLTVTFFIIPPIIRLMKKKGFVGKDIHKKELPEVAESGGISIVIGFAVASVVSLFFFPVFMNEILVVLYTVIMAGLIGFIDDRIKLRSRYKIVLTILTGSAIFISNYFGYIDINSPIIPFLGRTRLTILYPLAAPFIVAVFCNATNMLEGYNGEGSGTCLIAAIFIFICALIMDSAEGLLFTVISIAVLIPFFYYNKYPAKIFPGDVGTLSMGAIFACIALFGPLEVVVFCAFLIHIFNGFFVLSSVRGFFESTELMENRSDIIILENDKIMASSDKKAALSLPRLIAAKGAIKESELVKNFFIISIICGFFAIIAALFTNWAIGKTEIVVIIIVIFCLIVPTSLLLYKYHRIRGIIIIMILVLIAGIIVLIFADLYIMQIEDNIQIPIINLIIPLNIVYVAAIISPGLILWYVISIKYCWYEINKIKNKNNEAT